MKNGSFAFQLSSSLHRVQRDRVATDADPRTHCTIHIGHFVLSLNFFSWNEFGERQSTTQRCIISASQSYNIELYRRHQ